MERQGKQLLGSLGVLHRRKQQYSEAPNNEYHPRVEHHPQHRIANKEMFAKQMSGIYLPWDRLWGNKYLRET